MKIDTIELPSKEIDLELLIFVERYVTNLMKWDLLTYFGNNPSMKKDAQGVAKVIGRSHKAVRSELGDLAVLDLLQKSNGDSRAPTYTLTHDRLLRSQIIKFANQAVDA